MKQFYARSSDVYKLSVSDLLSLKKADNYNSKGQDVIILIGDQYRPDKLLSGEDVLHNALNNKEGYIDTILFYDSVNPVLGIIYHFIKSIKKKQIVKSKNIYKTRLSYILEKNILRGIRNAKNAYQGSSSDWNISDVEKVAKYNNLKKSLKENGFNDLSPIEIGLNRKVGFKDQVFQGHHRIGACKDIGLEDIAVSFCTFPASFRILPKFLYNK